MANQDRGAVLPGEHPLCRGDRCAEATASGSVVKGFCTAVALRPAACNRAITSDQHDPSANSPCTRTTFLAMGTVADRAAAGRRLAAAIAAAAMVKVRLSIWGMSLSFL